MRGSMIIVGVGEGGGEGLGFKTLGYILYHEHCAFISKIASRYDLTKSGDIGGSVDPPDSTVHCPVPLPLSSTFPFALATSPEIFKDSSF